MANIEGRNPIIEALRSDRPIDKLMISNTSKNNRNGKRKECSYTVCRQT